MQWTSILAIYALFWVMATFIMLPFGVKTHDELGVEKIPGQADSAPANFKPGTVIIRGTIISAICTAAYVLNYIYGWITPEHVDVTNYF